MCIQGSCLSLGLMHSLRLLRDLSLDTSHLESLWHELFLQPLVLVDLHIDLDLLLIHDRLHLHNSHILDLEIPEGLLLAALVDLALVLLDVLSALLVQDVIVVLHQYVRERPLSVKYSVNQVTQGEGRKVSYWNGKDPFWVVSANRTRRVRLVVDPLERLQTCRVQTLIHHTMQLVMPTAQDLDGFVDLKSCHHCIRTRNCWDDFPRHFFDLELAFNSNRKVVCTNVGSSRDKLNT